MRVRAVVVIVAAPQIPNPQVIPLKEAAIKRTRLRFRRRGKPILTHFAASRRLKTPPRPWQSLPASRSWCGAEGLATPIRIRTSRGAAFAYSTRRSPGNVRC
jgi:hypothetical protein